MLCGCRHIRRRAERLKPNESSKKGGGPCGGLRTQAQKAIQQLLSQSGSHLAGAAQARQPPASPDREGNLRLSQGHGGRPLPGHPGAASPPGRGADEPPVPRPGSSGGGTAPGGRLAGRRRTPYHPGNPGGRSAGAGGPVSPGGPGALPGPLLFHGGKAALPRDSPGPGHLSLPPALRRPASRSGRPAGDGPL